MWNTEELEFLRENYTSLGAVACTSTLLKTAKQIRTKANKMGLSVSKSTRSETQRRNATRPREKCNVDANKFINTTKEASYLLGLLWADGCLINTRQNPYRISLEILSSDFKNLESIIDSTGKWHKSTRKREGRKPQTTAVTNTKKLFNFLERMNYTGEIPLLDKIPDNLLPYWVRGFFDGDGCFYYHKEQCLRQMSLTGPYSQDWKFLTPILDELGVKYKIQQRVSKKGHKSSCILSSDKQSIKRFGDYIYQDNDGMWFDRKYQKLLAMML